MATLNECIDLYHARQAARTLHLTGSGVATIPGSGPSGDESGACAQTATSLPFADAAFGPVLRELRRRHRMTQAQLAGLTGIDHSYISQLERGGRRPSWALACELASALRLDRATRAVLLDAAVRVRRAS